VELGSRKTLARRRASALPRQFRRHKNLRYDLFEDFIPVTTVSSASEILTIGSKVPATVRTLADFVAWCRANPKDATYGSPGVGTPPHFIGAQLAQASGFEYTHVPYQGNGAAAQDLMAGQIASAMLTIDSAPLVLSGKIRALATTGPQRSSLLPDVPTFRESGYPMLERLDLWGIFLPAKTPLAIVEQLNNSVQEALKSDEVKAGLARSSIEPTAISLGEFASLVKADFESWGAVVKASGFTPQD
jgi:tripartite-type tricarboxylate transporter receptor subunit TctC